MVSNGFNGNDEETTKTIEKKLQEFESETKRRLTENTELQIKEVSEFKKIRSSVDDDRARTINLKKSVADKSEFLSTIFFLNFIVKYYFN